MGIYSCRYLVVCIHNWSRFRSAKTLNWTSFKDEYVIYTLQSEFGFNDNICPRSHDQFFVFKRVSKPFFDLSLRLAAEFPRSRRLRMHVDFNKDENVFSYPYYRNTLLGLVQEESKISDAARKVILRQGKPYKKCITRTGFESVLSPV